jgi:hypothetical protein
MKTIAPCINKVIITKHLKIITQPEDNLQYLVPICSVRPFVNFIPAAIFLNASLALVF